MSTIKDAAKLMDEAKKKGSKGFFNWSPDYDDAGDLYNKAANIYRNNSALNEAVKAFEGAAEMFEKCDHLGISAKAFENAGVMLFDNKKIVQGFPLMEKAAKYYIRDNKAQMASSIYTRTARELLDTEDPSLAEKATEMLQSGITALENDDKWILTKDMYRSVVLTLLRSKKFLDAVEVLKKQIPVLAKSDNQDQVAKNSLEIIIICLSLGDGVLAGRNLNDLSATALGFSGSEEWNSAQDLVSAFDDRDQERLNDVGKRQIFTFLIPEISRMAKKLKVDGGLAKKALAPVAPPANVHKAGATTTTALEQQQPAPTQQQQAEPEDDDEDIR